MISNCAIYLPIKNPPVKKVISGIKSDGGIFKKASFYEYDIDNVNIKISVMPDSDIQSHLNGMH